MKFESMIFKRNENGRVLIVVLVTVFTLSAFWFIALGETGLELRMVGGKKSSAQHFFAAEAGLNAAMDDFSTLSSSLSSDIKTAVSTKVIKDTTSAADPADQTVISEVTLRPIQRLDLSKAIEHNQPYQFHESAPQAGSGCGVNSCVSRRYSIDSKSGNKELQVGVYRYVPKNN